MLCQTAPRYRASEKKKQEERWVLCGQCRAMEKMGADPWLLLGPQLLLALSIHLPGEFCSPVPPDATSFPIPHLGLALPGPAVTGAIPGEG